MRWSTRFRACLPVATLLAAVALASPLDAQSGAPLEHVLDQMDKAGASFHTTEASFVWEQYISLVKEMDPPQKGKVYFRRAGNETQMAVDITEPYAKYVLVSGGKVQLYERKADRITVYDLAKHRDEFESFLVLGFGGGGHSLQKSFAITYKGTETIDGVEAAKLDLVPKSEKVLNTFPHIMLWIDPARGVSVQQQLFQADGDYRLAKYSDIQLNQKIADSVFKLKTGNKTTMQSNKPQD